MVRQLRAQSGVVHSKTGAFHLQERRLVPFRSIPINFTKMFLKDQFANITEKASVICLLVDFEMILLGN